MDAVLVVELGDACAGGVGQSQGRVGGLEPQGALDAEGVAKGVEEAHGVDLYPVLESWHA